MSGRSIPGGSPYAPFHVVWELTMRCDHACAHCGSHAVKARPGELDTAELLDVADALVRLGTREVALVVGEAYPHPGLLPVTRRLAQTGAASPGRWRTSSAPPPAASAPGSPRCTPRARRGWSRRPTRRSTG